MSRDLVRSLSLLAVVSCGGDSGPGPITTRPVHHMEARLAPASGDLEAIAAGYVRSLDGELALGLSAEDEHVITQVSASGGIRHARMQQVHGGVPVVGAEVIVHADDHMFLGFDGYLTGNLAGFDLAATVSDGEAMATARDDLAATPLAQSSRLVILPDGEAGARLAWHIQLATAGADGVPAGRWNVYVDARDGAILERYDAIATAIEQGSGTGGNLGGAFVWQEELDVFEVDDEYIMQTGKLATLDGAGGLEPVLSPELASFADRAANNAHGHTEITLNMMHEWMGRRSVDGQGLEVVSVVHDAATCPGNACWSGDRVHYDDAGHTDAIDLVAHEIGHGFTMFHSNLVNTASESGSLNESFSDIAGVAAEFYHEGMAANFIIGEDALAAGLLRNVCDPKADGASIDHASQFDAGLSAHRLSGVPNKAFCLAVARFVAMGMSTVDAVRAIGGIWFTANAAYWTSGASWFDGCAGTRIAARAQGYDSAAIEALTASWADVGVDCGSVVFACNGDNVCDVRAGETCASCGDCGSCWEVCGAYHQALCEEGLADCSECENYEDRCGNGSCEDDETDASCGQDCGCAELLCEADVAPFGCWCYQGCEEYGDCCADYYELCD